MNTCVNRCMTILALGGVMLTSAHAGEHFCQAKKYAIIDLGTLGGDYSIASAINEKNQVVGNSTTIQGEYHAFRWNDGVMAGLGTNSGAAAINNRGQVVGSVEVANNQSHAYLWKRILTGLETLGGAYSYATAINDHGQIVGLSSIANGKEHAFLWNKGVMADLGAPDDLNTIATKINGRGQVIGQIYTTSGEYHHDFI